MSIIKVIFIGLVRIVGAMTVIFGVVAALCQLNTQCAGVMDVLIEPLWESAETFVDGNEPVAGASASYSLYFQRAVEAHADGELILACKNYVAAKRKLDRLEALNARLNTHACRCTVANYMKDICDNSADVAVKQACRCDRRLPTPEQTDCMSTCTIADASSTE